MKKLSIVFVLAIGFFNFANGQQSDNKLYADNSLEAFAVGDTPKKSQPASATYQYSEPTSSKAQFPGGLPAMFDYISDEVDYPKTARELGDEGSVMVQFVVSPDGSITNIELMNFVSPELDAEALRVVQEMPNWQPAQYNGRAVKSKVVVPIRFAIW